jgi:hypothetical protein
VINGRLKALNSRIRLISDREHGFYLADRSDRRWDLRGASI